MDRFLRLARPTATLVVAFTLLLGLGYPLAVLGLGRVIAPDAAGGSLARTADGTVIGSNLIGQRVADPAYLQGRPSAAGDAGYDAAASSGANLALTSKKLQDRVAADVAALRDQGVEGPIPADAVTSSASGLDPHVSPGFARAQAKRIAAARGRSAAEVTALIEAHVERPALGVIGEPRVNVLAVNLALDAQLPKRK